MKEKYFIFESEKELLSELDVHLNLLNLYLVTYAKSIEDFISKLMAITKGKVQKKKVENKINKFVEYRKGTTEPPPWKREPKELIRMRDELTIDEKEKYSQLLLMYGEIEDSQPAQPTPLEPSDEIEPFKEKEVPTEPPDEKEVHKKSSFDKNIHVNLRANKQAWEQYSQVSSKLGFGSGISYLNRFMEVFATNSKARKTIIDALTELETEKE